MLSVSCIHRASLDVSQPFSRAPPTNSFSFFFLSFLLPAIRYGYHRPHTDKERYPPSLRQKKLCLLFTSPYFFPFSPPWRWGRCQFEQTWSVPVEWLPDWLQCLSRDQLFVLLSRCQLQTRLINANWVVEERTSCVDRGIMVLRRVYVETGALFALDHRKSQDTCVDTLVCFTPIQMSIIYRLLDSQKSIAEDT